MWTPVTRREHSRDVLRHGSDLTDTRWEILAPLIPQPGRSGQPRKWPMREIVNATFYLLRGGIVWRLLPKDFPPMTTVYAWFLRFRRPRLFETINHHLVMIDGDRVGRKASLSAAVIDSQSVKTTEAGGPRGYDAAKNVKGRKRHAMVDTNGRALVIQAHPADVQDRDGAVPLLKASRNFFPSVEHVFLVFTIANFLGQIVNQHIDRNSQGRDCNRRIYNGRGTKGQSRNVFFHKRPPIGIWWQNAQAKEGQA